MAAHHFSNNKQVVVCGALGLQVNTFAAVMPSSQPSSKAVISHHTVPTATSSSLPLTQSSDTDQRCQGSPLIGSITALEPATM